jgi:hypothetical protein
MTRPAAYIAVLRPESRSAPQAGVTVVAGAVTTLNVDAGAVVSRGLLVAVDGKAVAGACVAVFQRNEAGGRGPAVTASAGCDGHVALRTEVAGFAIAPNDDPNGRLILSPPKGGTYLLGVVYAPPGQRPPPDVPFTTTFVPSTTIVGIGLRAL